MNTEAEDRESLYFSRIESCFIGLRGSPLLLCGKDFILMKQWYHAGIPLHIVLRGIQETFEKMEGQKPPGKKINSLRYCEQTVMQAWEANREARIGRHGPGEEAEDGPGALKGIADHLEKLLAACRNGAPFVAGDKDREENFDRALERLECLIREARSDRAPALEKIETSLMGIERDIVALLKKTASPGTLEKHREAYRRKIVARAGSMAGETLDGMVENLLNERLLTEAGIPRLSLFS